MGGLGGNEDLENCGDHTSVDTTPIVVAHTGEANMPPPAGPLKPQVEQLRELEQKLEEERQHLNQQSTALEQELRNCDDGRAA
jgi:hypothetical protein